MSRRTRSCAAFGLLSALAGCASDRGQYAYAPPLAPPVYSQPAGYATPPPAALPGPAAPPTLAAAPVVAGGVVPGAVLPATAVDPCAGAVTADGVVVETPCDEGVVMADGAVVVGATVDGCCGDTVVR